MMRRVAFYSLALLTMIAGCQNQSDTKSGQVKGTYDPGERIETAQRDTIFQQLTSIGATKIDAEKADDSLSFMILPLEASCPACREKTIDSILKYQDRIPDNHYIILSLKGSTKRITGYFQQHDGRLPTTSQFILDTLNLASKYELHQNNPTFYYTKNGKAVVKKVGLPETIREDLHHFFNAHKEL